MDTMHTSTQPTTVTSTKKRSPFAPVVRASKRTRWDIDADVIRGRTFDLSHKFLPDGLSRIPSFSGLSPTEQRLLSQIQGRTYANVFGLVERFINAKIVELSSDYVLGDQVALEGLIRFSDDELKHQELFRRIDGLVGQGLPPGYAFLPDPDEVARAVLGSSTWAVLTLTLHIELFTQKHYQESIAPDEALSPLYKDVFRYHWREEAHHAVMDEIELRKLDATISDAQRDQYVTDFIGLVVAVDGILQVQTKADTDYFLQHAERERSPSEREQFESELLAAYRWQYILSGAEQPHFLKVLTELISEQQAGRIMDALGTLR